MWRRWGSILVAMVLTAGGLGWGAGVRAQEGAYPELMSLAERLDQAMAMTILGLDGDPEAARTWVRDQVSTESYPGMLKGARGAFMARSGNDVDEALLLGAFLDGAQVAHRFASCAWSRPTVTDAGTTEKDPPASELAAAIAAAVTDPDLKAAALELPAMFSARQDSADGAAMSLADAIAGMPALPVPDGGDTTPQRHTWLQYAWGAEWRDLDPATPTGAAPCVPDSVTNEIPPAARHTLTISLEIEQRTAGVVTTVSALSTKVDVAALATVPVTFAFGLPDSVGARIAGLGGTSAYSPVLLVGDAVTTGAAITFASPTGDPLGDVFGTPPPDGTQGMTDGVTAAWLRFDLRSPDGTVVTRRSEIFDRVGIVSRQSDSIATALMAPLEVVGGEYAALDRVWVADVLTGETRAPEAVADTSAALTFGAETMAPVDALLRLYPGLYHRLGGTPTGPIILLAGLARDAGTSDGADPSIILDALYVPGVTTSDSAAAARDAAAAATGESLLLDLAGASQLPLASIDAVFAAARAASVPLLLLRPGDKTDIVAASPAALARIESRLAEGYSIVTPARSVVEAGVSATAWWVIDPTTGVIRDEHESGRHTDMGEETVTNKPVPGWAKKMHGLMCKVSAPLIVVAGLLGVLGGKAGGNVVKVIAKTAQGADEQAKRTKKARDIACLGNGSQGGPPKP